jgi:hypothetical protein
MAEPPDQMPAAAGRGDLRASHADREQVIGTLKAGRIRACLPVPAVELDMPVPPGLSGGPLFRADPFEVVGVIIGEPVEPSGQPVDEVICPAAGICRFGAAHRLGTLR